ncbi:MAG TPA: YcgN family cysteine cluster protein [Gammaproteobacteria bacterium]
MSEAFWQSKTLAQMSEAEWESLCDGCGRCCLIKLEDEDTGELHFTSVSCHLLDIDSCRCKDYPNRQFRVPECLQVKNMAAEEYQWLPASCAYRLLAQGQPLYDWHPLISGRQASVAEAGITVARLARSEDTVRPRELQEHIIQLKP